MNMVREFVERHRQTNERLEQERQTALLEALVMLLQGAATTAESATGVDARQGRESPSASNQPAPSDPHSECTLSKPLPRADNSPSSAARSAVVEQADLVKTVQVQVQGLMAERAAAKYLGIGVKTLRNWRYAGGGPRFVLVGPRTPRYRLADLDAFIEARTVANTGEGQALLTTGR